MRAYPAIDVHWPIPPSDDDVDRLLADLDDFGPTAVEPRPSGVRVFFGDAASRDAARGAVDTLTPKLQTTPVDVPDEGWAERSQASLRPVRIDNVIVAPPWTVDEVHAGSAAGDAPIVIAIQPSMGFGTGHHQTTRLCLRLLQRHLVPGARVLDIGTGSGVLAIAAWKLGAAGALGIDVDRDALSSAEENLGLNDAVGGVSLEVADIARDAATLSGRFDLVLANITGATLQRCASAVTSTLAPGAVLVTSGFQTHELDDVTAAFAGLGLARLDYVEEETWLAAAFR